MAAWAWLLWDWATSFDDEINYVWIPQWSLSKILYICTRYFGIFLLTIEAASDTRTWSAEFCSFYFTITGIGTMVSLYLVEIAMQVRVHALYGGSKRILYINSAIFAVEVAALSTMLGWERTHNINIIPAPQGLMGCWNTKHPKLITICWFVGLAFEIYLFTLVAYKAYVRWKDEGRLMGVFSIMFRDAVMWFGVIAALLAWNAFAFATGKDGSIFLGLPFMHAASSIAGSKLVVDIRKAWQEGEQNSMIFVAIRPPSSRPPPPLSASKSSRLPASKASGQKKPKKDKRSTYAIHKVDSDWDITSPGNGPDSSSEMIAMEELRAMPVYRSLSGRLVNALSTSAKRHADVVVVPASDQLDWRDRSYKELRSPPRAVGATRDTRGGVMDSTDHLRNPQQHVHTHPYAAAGDGGGYV
ncbi:hypothetical protein M407DRAFT_98606 [Tulasnella calospora MUT 4182]|uniref:DUF6533 domain-containing protein n=1 Tax=Tulasnella calospora MUT 4182 TaxID=1051891 RepID=A0A0C3KTE8_9AGAM|nr:hypothetical protein M407DRAFT_98606 [Tulasnella calospora MUT 4182]